MPQLTFVTGNEGKIKEAELILGFPIQKAKIDLDEIQSLDIEQVVIKKTQAAFDLLHTPLIVDDSAYYFDTWNGFPGPLVKFIDKAGGIPLMLHMFEHETNRAVSAVCSVGYHDGTDIHVFTGKVDGHVTTEPHGEHGWGWDNIFQPIGSSKTYGEMTDVEKSAISHRRLALEQLKAYLTNNAPRD